MSAFPWAKSTRETKRLAAFEAWPVAADDPELAELPPVPARRRRR